MEKDFIQQILDEKPNYRNLLFSRGYLITSTEIEILFDYPFYGNWRKKTCGKLSSNKSLNIYIHNKGDFYEHEYAGINAVIIGHAYNPFTNKYNEDGILEDIIISYQKGESDFFKTVNELTGIHVIVLNDKGKVIIVQDCGGIKSCYYGIVDDNIYLSSHPQLLGDILELEVDPDVNSLINKWFYSLGGASLPGDSSPYNQIKRLGPNTFLTYNNTIELKRFYPTHRFPEIKPEDYHKVITEIASLIHRNIELCTKKWNNPAISLSGGMDSKTTLACANGLYDKYKFFSFHCKPQELVDATAAHQICEKIGVAHTIYAIPEKNEYFEEFDILKKIIFHNSSYIGKPRDHEIRKYIFLSRLNDFDVELKSWISEIGRAMQGKKYKLKLPKTLTPRHFSIFQSRYLGSPGLLKKADQLYKDYLLRVDMNKPLYNYDHADAFYWEFRWGSWGTNVNTTHDIFNHTITMPMNNRKIMEMFLWFPYNYRKEDKIHKEVIKYSNRLLSELEIIVLNKTVSFKRVLVERLYYYYRTSLLFKRIYY